MGVLYSLMEYTIIHIKYIGYIGVIGYTIIHTIHLGIIIEEYPAREKCLLG